MNKYLEKVATALYDTSNDDVLRGLVSQGWNRHNIAGQYGEDAKGVVPKHFTGMFRQGMRSGLEGFGVGALGGVVGNAIGNTMHHAGVPGAARTARAIGGVAALGGTLHGLYASSKNQSDEMHQEFAAKAALKKALAGRG